MELTVPQRKIVPYPNYFFPLGLILGMIANITLTSMIIFAVLLDIVAWFYQTVYFGIDNIPKIKRSKYVRMSRQSLKGLSPMQKWSCWYCEYTNGVIAWVKAIANQTEIYSCAIKYSHHYEGQEYQEKFYEQSEFDMAKHSDNVEWKIFFAVLVGVGIGLLGVGMINFYFG